MGDRASVHISIGGKLLRVHLEALAAHVADYDLRVDWDGEPFDPEAITEGEPLELYGTELNGGLIDEIDTFCVRHGLPLAWTTDGQQVPEDLARADATRLVLRLEELRRAAERPTDDAEDAHVAA